LYISGTINKPPTPYPKTEAFIIPLSLEPKVLLILVEKAAVKNTSEFNANILD
jgi:hypothetical protein